MTDSFQAGGRRVLVLYLDNHLLAVEKPPNMPTQADESRDLDLLTACKAYIAEKFQKPGEAFLGLVHRLDRPAGGAMVFARTSKAAARLTKAFAGHDLEKIYLAVAEGEIKEPGALKDDLIKGADGMVRVAGQGEPGAKEARLRYRPLHTAEGLTLLEVSLETGAAPPNSRAAGERGPSAVGRQPLRRRRARPAAGAVVAPADHPPPGKAGPADVHVRPTPRGRLGALPRCIGRVFPARR